MRPSSLLRLLPLLALLGLADCRSRDNSANAPANMSPEATVRQSIALVRAGDFAGFWRHALPPRDYAMLREDWGQPRTGEKPLAATERARIDEVLRQLAAPDAATTLDARLQPWLADAHARYGDQLPLLVGIGRALATREIEESPSLTDTQKRHATAVVDALGPWAQRAPLVRPGQGAPGGSGRGDHCAGARFP